MCQQKHWNFETPLLAFGLLGTYCFDEKEKEFCSLMLYLINSEAIREYLMPSPAEVSSPQVSGHFGLKAY